MIRLTALIITFTLLLTRLMSTPLSFTSATANIIGSVDTQIQIYCDNNKLPTGIICDKNNQNCQLQYVVANQDLTPIKAGGIPGEAQENYRILKTKCIEVIGFWAKIALEQYSFLPNHPTQDSMIKCLQKCKQVPEDSQTIELDLSNIDVICKNQLFLKVAVGDINRNLKITSDKIGIPGALMTDTGAVCNQFDAKLEAIKDQFPNEADKTRIGDACGNVCSVLSFTHEIDRVINNLCFNNELPYGIFCHRNELECRLMAAEGNFNLYNVHPSKASSSAQMNYKSLMNECNKMIEFWARIVINKYDSVTNVIIDASLKSCFEKCDLQATGLTNIQFGLDRLDALCAKGIFLNVTDINLIDNNLKINKSNVGIADPSKTGAGQVCHNFTKKLDKVKEVLSNNADKKRVEDGCQHVCELLSFEKTKSADVVGTIDDTIKGFCEDNSLVSDIECDEKGEKCKVKYTKASRSLSDITKGKPGSDALTEYELLMEQCSGVIGLWREIVSNQHVYKGKSVKTTSLATCLKNCKVRLDSKDEAQFALTDLDRLCSQGIFVKIPALTLNLDLSKDNLEKADASKNAEGEVCNIVTKKLDIIAQLIPDGDIKKIKDACQHVCDAKDTDDGLSGGAIAGIVIGSVAGAALLIGLAVFIVKKCKK